MVSPLSRCSSAPFSPGELGFAADEDVSATPAVEISAVLVPLDG
jgi:hypothetical protein